MPPTPSSPTPCSSLVREFGHSLFSLQPTPVIQISSCPFLLLHRPPMAFPLSVLHVLNPPRNILLFLLSFCPSTTRCIQWPSPRIKELRTLWRCIGTGVFGRVRWLPRSLFLDHRPPPSTTSTKADWPTGIESRLISLRSCPLRELLPRTDGLSTLLRARVLHRLPSSFYASSRAAVNHADVPPHAHAHHALLGRRLLPHHCRRGPSLACGGARAEPKGRSTMGQGSDLRAYLPPPLDLCIVRVGRCAWFRCVPDLFGRLFGG